MSEVFSASARQQNGRGCHRCRIARASIHLRRIGDQEVAQEIFERTGHKRHFIKSDEILNVMNGSVAICTEWGSGNINSFLERAEALGFEIEPTSGNWGR